MVMKAEYSLKLRHLKFWQQHWAVLYDLLKPIFQNVGDHSIFPCFFLMKSQCSLVQVISKLCPL